MSCRRDVLLALVTAALCACENGDVPLAPAWSKQRCGHCSMLVGDKRFAAQLISASGERLFFDDPGCLASYRLAHAASRHAWVLSDGHWLDADTARFISGARSPMDYGFEARASGTLGWADVTRAVQERQPMGAR